MDSICSRACWPAASFTFRSTPGSGLRSELHDGANLNRPNSSSGNASGDLNGLVQVLRVNQVVTTKLFLGFGERTVGGGNFPLPDANRCGGLGRLQRIAANVLAAFLDVLGKCSVLL